MPPASINYISVLVATAANMGLGFFWYSPVLFGNTWAKLKGIDLQNPSRSQSSMRKVYAVIAVAAFFSAFVLAHIIAYAEVLGAASGTALGFWLWLGFVLPVHLNSHLFSGREFNFKLFLIDTLYPLATLTVSSALISTWH